MAMSGGAQQPGRPARLARLSCLLAVLVVGWAQATAVLAHLVRSFSDELSADAPADAQLDAVVGLVAAAAALAVLTWLTAALATALVSTALRADAPLSARRALVDRVTPRALRRLAALLLGLGLVAAPLASSAAAAGAGGARPAARCATGPVPAPSLDRPAASAGTTRPVRVHRGDTLWGIAGRHLGPGAGLAQIAQEWPRWHRANRSVIGADPDHLVPGQLLRPPTVKEIQ